MAGAAFGCGLWPSAKVHTSLREKCFSRRTCRREKLGSFRRFRRKPKGDAWRPPWVSPGDLISTTPPPVGGQKGNLPHRYGKDPARGKQDGRPAGGKAPGRHGGAHDDLHAVPGPLQRGGQRVRRHAEPGCHERRVPGLPPADIDDRGGGRHRCGHERPGPRSLGKSGRSSPTAQPTSASS